MNFDTFIVSPKIRSTWIYERDIQVYVRRSNRHIDGNLVSCLDIASVEVNEDRRGQGMFKAFLNRFEKAAALMNREVFVESILEPRLLQFLLKRNYTLIPNSIPPCVHKKIQLDFE
jgi:hypothetical protein